MANLTFEMKKFAVGALFVLFTFGAAAEAKKPDCGPDFVKDWTLRVTLTCDAGKTTGKMYVGPVKDGKYVNIGWVLSFSDKWNYRFVVVDANTDGEKVYVCRQNDTGELKQASQDDLSEDVGSDAVNLAMALSGAQSDCTAKE